MLPCVVAAAPRPLPVTGSAAVEPNGWQLQAGRRGEQQLEVYCWLQQQVPVDLMVRVD